MKKRLPPPLVPAHIDGRLLGEPPWEVFKQMLIDLGATRDEAEAAVAAVRGSEQTGALH